jgi:single-strand DNA-binding protein
MVNKVILVGRLGKDPFMKSFSNDSLIAEFNLVTNESYRDREGNLMEQTEWHNIKVPSRRQAELVEKFLRKGSLIYLEGKLRTRSWEDREGIKRYTTEIVVENFRMLEPRRDQPQTADQEGAAFSRFQRSTAPKFDEPDFNNFEEEQR